MKVVGIIAEYNPFHRGHAYQLDYARNTLGADYVIVVMSGPFTQRGCPAIFDKYERARQALCGGADLILELPVCYATASAEYFASAGVQLLSDTNIVSTLLFGCETPDRDGIRQTAELLLEEPAPYRDALQRYLANGHSFPKARMSALSECGITFPLDRANNILAVEYVKALLRSNSTIEAVPMARKESDYHSLSLDSAYASATAIRNALWETAGAPSLSAELLQVIPQESHEQVKTLMATRQFLHPNDVSPLLHYALIRETNFMRYFDSCPELSARIERYLDQYVTFTDFCSLLKTKNLTHSRISRSLCHILLDINETFVSEVMKDNRVSYLRVLGFRKDSAVLLQKLDQNSSLPLITSPKDTCQLLDEPSRRMLGNDLLGSDLYRVMLTKKAGHACPTEFTRKLLVME